MAAVDHPAGLRRVGVEGRDDLQARPEAAEERDDRAPEIPETDERDALAAGVVQELLDTAAELLDVVTAARRALVADDHQVATHLRGRGSGERGDAVGEDLLLALLEETGEEATVQAEPADRLVGDDVVAVESAAPWRHRDPLHNVKCFT